MLYSLILLLSVNGFTDYYTVEYNLSYQDCLQYLEGRNSNEAQCLLQTEIIKEG